MRHRRAELAHVHPREIEATFAKAFIEPHRRERALFDLSSRRGRFLSRLSHDYEDLFVRAHLVSIAPPNSDPREIERLLRAQGAPERCYVISCHDGLDGTEADLAEALTTLVGYGLPSIIICVPDRLAYFEGEQEVGPPPRYMLRRR